MALKIIPHSRPYFDEEDAGTLLNILRKNFVTNGNAAAKFGDIGAKVLHKKWGIPVQSGTDAIILALKILELDKSAKIAVPAYACGAILDAAAFCRLRVIPVDISRDTLAMNPDAINSVSCDAVIAAHLFGIAAPLFRIRHKLLIEDCAQCFGISYKKITVGKTGKLSLLSSYGTKIIATGHGGLLAGNDKKFLDRAKKLLKHDKVDDWVPHLHFLMSDLNASVGITQIQKLDFFIKKRRAIASLYNEAICGKPQIPGNEMFFRYNIISLTGDSSSLLSKLNHCGIEAQKPVYKPIYKILNLPSKLYPEAKWADENLVSIPIYPALQDEELERILKFLKKHKNEISRWPSA